jgi:hypothetical protein
MALQLRVWCRGLLVVGVAFAFVAVALATGDGRTGYREATLADGQAGAHHDWRGVPPTPTGDGGSCPFMATTPAATEASGVTASCPSVPSLRRWQDLKFGLFLHWGECLLKRSVLTHPLTHAPLG